MGNTAAIALMSLGVFALRVLGLVAPLDAVPGTWRRALRTLPVALLAALVASSRSGLASGEPARIVALLVAGVVVWRSRRLWSAIVSGVAVYWVCRTLGWGG